MKSILQFTLVVFFLSACGTGQRTDDMFALDDFQLPVNSDDFAPIWSPDGAQLAFTSQRDGNMEIYLYDLRSGDEIRLTDNSADDHLAVWSPNGTKLAFISERDGNAEVYVMNSDGSGKRNITNHPANDGEFPVWVNEEKILFFSDRDGDNEIYTVDLKDFEVTQLTDNGHDDALVTISPDKNRIAFNSDREGSNDIFTMNIDGSDLKRITFNDRFNDRDPKWSADGEKIAFHSDRIGSWDIYVMNADGTDQVKISEGDALSPDWSPDNTKIAFQGNYDGRRGIYLMNTDGSGLEKLTNRQENRFIEMLMETPLEEKALFHNRIRSKYNEAALFDEREIRFLINEHMNIEDVKTAIELSKIYAAAHPENFISQIYLGRAYLLAGEKQLSVKSYEIAQTLSPDSQMIQRMLANAKAD